MVVIIMGVAGSGKTTIGRRLAAELGCSYFDADDLHSAANVRKMARGEPLDDRDRQPWLDDVEALIRKLLEEEASAVVGCSALKQRYRDQLTVSDQVRWVYLTADPALVARRLQERPGHFMPVSLLPSQLRDLEEPGPDVPRIDVEPAPEAVVEAVRAALGV